MTTMELEVGELSTLSPDPVAAFAWWESLDTPYTRGTRFSDWQHVVYRDAVCFFLSEDDTEAYLVRGAVMLHFGRDYDTIESAYASLPEPYVDGSRIVRRYRPLVSN
jgi:hypothetical protein